ncbi:uncharacterized protein EV420DRAFT_814572 [Desarmillaria tabescens]|uniref:Uncharacterized protein n=1 Tax=Armillaria tabescens TaxID=1929756 RepID=A0AA39TXN8_ARMTA|nr:uncharacterized protein EV420DRAFT_814572 [Desarmillaria tabescens]KAK0466184.1 hypothetical protein EV420DRAFT_814572 [Desarmillaria tabescens]
MPIKKVLISQDCLLITRLPEEPHETKRHIAENIEHVTEENEQYIRSYHPAFEDANSVIVYCNPSSINESVWMIHPTIAQTNAFLLDNLSVAGREVHPFEYIPPWPPRMVIYPRHIEDPLRGKSLNPRVPLSDDDLSVLRQWWPNIIGVRMYVCGVISLLLHQWADWRQVAAYGWSWTIGGLRAQIESVQAIEPSVDRTPYGLQDGTRRYSQTGTKQIGSTGLRIRGRFGPDKSTVSDAITTNTHSFVYTPCGMSMHSSLTDVPIREILFDIVHDIIMLVKYRIAATKTYRTLCDSPPVFRALTRVVGDTSPLEKEVRMGSRKVGKITKCYDFPSFVFMYPFGYRHDLSLITDAALPQVTVPPGLPIITGFEPTFDAALRPGCPLFTARYCLDTQTAEQPVPVQAVATQYTWEPEPGSSAISRCLLWRSSNQSDTTGSVLCLGSPGDHETRAVVFQNFEAKIRHTQMATTSVKSYSKYKGGFALPKEVLESEVVMQRLRT